MFAFSRKFMSKLFKSLLKWFKIFSDCHIKACRSLKSRPILKIPILKEPMFFPLALKWNLYEKAFSCVKTKIFFAVNLAEMLKEATIHFFLMNHIFQTSVVFNYVTIQYIEINWLCKHSKKVRSSQARISINSCTELIRQSFSCFVKPI